MNQKMQKISKRGFTLIELLVVIGILAVLTAAVVVVLNPAELLKQARDAQRLSDFDALRSAISLYLSTATTPSFGGSNAAYAMNSTNCYYVANGGTCATKSGTGVDGTTNNWVPINFNELTTVGLSSPLSALPTDPSNTATLHYAIGTDFTNKYYVLKTVLESIKYDDKMLTDGGGNGSYSTTTYEVGNHPGMNL